jgi:hypothetical protein
MNSVQAVSANPDLEQDPVLELLQNISNLTQAIQPPASSSSAALVAGLIASQSSVTPNWSANTGEGSGGSGGGNTSTASGNAGNSAGGASNPTPQSTNQPSGTHVDQYA